jgi:hypothetical protein
MSIDNWILGFRPCVLPSNGALFGKSVTLDWRIRESQEQASKRLVK